MSNLLTEKETWIDKLVDELVDTKNEVASQVVDVNRLYTITKLIFNNARLDYGGEGLRIENESAIFEYLRVIDPDGYYKRLNLLKDEREAELKKIAETAEYCKKESKGKKEA